MTKRKYLEKCYYCGEPACTDEHVPPQTMFDSTCDSITVPSCEKHNTVKGASDQAVLNGFLLTLNGASTRYHFKQEVLNAAEKKQPSFKRTKYKTFSARLLENQEDLPAIGYVTSEVDVKKWMRHLTAALVWDGIGYFEYKINENNYCLCYNLNLCMIYFILFIKKLFPLSSIYSRYLNDCYFIVSIFAVKKCNR